MDVGKVIALADQLLDADQNGDDFVELLERYSAAFSRWHVRFLGEIEKGQVDAELKRQAQSLAGKHERILERAKAAQRQVMEDLKKTRNRGRAILSYADGLPRRISIGRARKG